MWLKRLKYFFIGLGIIIVIAITILFTVLYFYEDEIKEFALIELNQRLEAELKVGEIELSVFDQFPAIAIKFNDLLIEDKFIEKDTFLFARELYMNMDFFDALAGDYNVKKIIGEHVNLKLKVDSSGEGNYDIWKSDTISKNEDIQFVLKQVEINDLHLAYNNYYQNQHYSFYTKHIDFSGDFNKNIYDLSARSHVLVKEFTADQVKYLSNKKADLDLKIEVNNDSSTYLIKKGDLKIEGMNFEVNGYYQNLETSFIDLNFKGRSIVLESLFSVFPIDVLTSLNEYKTKGNVAFNAQLKGNISNEKNPVFKADFKLESGKMEEKQTNTKLNDIYLEGSFVNINEAGHQQLSLKNIKAILGGEAIAGNLSVINFNSPILKGDVYGIVSLEKLTSFASISAFNLGGDADLGLAYKIRFNEKADDYKIDLLKGDVKILNMQGGFFENKITLAQTNGRFYFQNKAFQSNRIKGNVNGSPFNLKITLENCLDYVTTISDQLIVKSELKISEFNFNDLVSSDKEVQQKTNLELPANIKLKTELNIGILKYDNLIANKLKSSLVLNDQTIALKDLSFHANNGVYELSSSIKKDEKNRYLWSVIGNAKKINVADFFYSFGNFGQNYLTDRHLKGVANATFNFNTDFDHSLTLDPERISSSVKLDIKKGELIGHSSMLDIADYLDGNLLVKAVINTGLLKSNLKHIYFSELSNEIEIKNGIITIPKMDISSSVMNMSLFGTHGFNDSIDYHFSFRLRELMVKDHSENEFGPIKDDGLGKIIYLNMYGTVDNPLFKLDQKEKKQNIKENIKEEKQEIKSVLKEEFGLFTKDSTIKSQKEKTDSTIFEVEWDEESKEEDNSTDKQNKSKDTTKKKNGKLNKLLKKLGVEEEEEKEVEFEIDQGD